MNDLRFGARVLGRNRASSVTIILLLALGIGAGTAIFSLFDAIVLRPLPVSHPEQLVRLIQQYPRIGVRSSFRYSFYETLRDQNGSLAAVFGEAGDYLRFTLTDPAPAEQIIVLAVTPEYFSALGVQARFGRALTAEDARPSSSLPPVVLSYPFWARRFNADPQAVGRTLAVNGQRFAIVGILPHGFNGLSAETAPDIRIPLNAFPLLGKKQKDWDLQLAARMRPGVTRARAESEVFATWSAILQSQMATDPEGAKWELQFRLTLQPLDKGFSILRDRFGAVLQWLMASAILLALLTCVNIAGLLAARISTRSHEIAVRLAVGATRRRLVRQMLAENLLISALGTAGGLAIAFAVMPLLARSLPPIRQLDTSLVPLIIDIGVDGRVLLFAILLSLVTMLLFTLAPAIASCRAGLDSVLRGARSSRSWRGRQALITLQIALCTFLLCGAGLQVRTFRKLHDQNPGFNPDHVATFTLDLTKYKAQSEASFLQAFTDRVRALPGVKSVAISSRGVLRERGVATTVAPVGHTLAQADFLNADFHEVSPEYFETLEIPILAGRSLEAEDTPPVQPAPVIVNQAFARRFFPSVDPIGKRFGGGAAGAGKVAGANFEIIGLCSDAKYRSMREPMKPTFYQIYRSSGSPVLNVRTQSPPQAILEPARQLLHSLDPTLAFVEVHTLAQEVDASTAGERLAAALATSFACLAALLAAVGIYGLLANAVAQRSREIGIRMAVGANALAIAALLWRQTLAMAAGGIFLGIAAMFWIGPLIRSVLYEVSPHDTLSLAAAAALVALIAAVSTAVPAARAVAVDPATVLHE